MIYIEETILKMLGGLIINAPARQMIYIEETILKMLGGLIINAPAR
jgi:hypothetical protein